MLNKFIPFALALLLSAGSAAATDNGNEPEESTRKNKSTKALRTTQAPVLDGYLEPDVWQQAYPARNFIRYDPLNGMPSSQQTEVYMLYDNDAIYIGALLHDTAPDSVLTQLGQRDSGENNADMFGVYLDTYNDKQNAFAFLVSAAGVQTDIKHSQGREDWNWDAVWASSVKTHDKGWTVEMRIPYAAIRFPKAEVQTWGVNYMRVIRRTREKSFWSYVDNSVEGLVNQEGRAIGIDGIQSPVRLQFMPYISGYVNHYPGKAEENRKAVTQSINGGMDVKYGINDAFTLDVTLIPDFGQTQSDNQVLNLSPFEVKFNENRSFFTEGTELFNKAGLFYSRRIGQAPLLHRAAKDSLRAGEAIIENPGVTQLLNAAKVSGRTRKGLGVGVFNAFTKNMYAVVEDSLTGEKREVLTDPLTNYNVFVLDQTLPRNSFITFTNTNVTRSKGLYDANVSGLQLRLADKSNTFALRAGSNLSQLYGKYTNAEGQLQDITLGHQYNINLAKVSGNLQYYLNHNVESDTYDINDLGYISNNNEMSTSAGVSYRFYQPVWKFLSWGNSLSVHHSMLYAPREFISLSVNGSSNVRFRNFMSAYWSFNYRPGDRYDYFEARSFPQVFVRPGGFDTNLGISTDYRKRMALDASTGLWRSDRYDQTSWWANFSPRFRVNDKFSFVNGNSYRLEQRNIGYAGKDAYNHVVFGDRTVTTLSTTLSSAYIFNERAGLTLNMRHYWSRAEYRNFYALSPEGLLQATSLARNGDLSKFNDINYNTFTLDLVYSWRFAPGSELRLVWKNAIQDSSSEIMERYIDNMYKTLQVPQNNNFSVKLLYFLDYIAIKNVLSA
ncbi:hypothetical protein GCM10027443_10930 [Pontibacter brevis]